MRYRRADACGAVGPRRNGMRAGSPENRSQLRDKTLWRLSCEPAGAAASSRRRAPGAWAWSAAFGELPACGPGRAAEYPACALTSIQPYRGGHADR